MNVLYLSHVDSRWIKQRPHFLAEVLDDELGGLLFVYARAYSRGNLVRDTIACRALPILLVPQRLRGRLRLLDALLQRLLGVCLGILGRPRVVWVTSARMATLGMAAAKISGARLVFDLMDRTAEFENAAPDDGALESALIGRADLVTCSSSALVADVLHENPSARVHLMRNALSDPDAWRRSTEGSAERAAEEYTMGYAGALSSWFDWEVVSSALQSHPGWRLKVWGPIDAPVPAHPRILAEGTAEHSALPALLGRCDVLVMPFVVTRLIEAVDPVKAYEYIATGLPVVLTRYGETEHFGGHARLYDAGDSESFADAVWAAARSRPSAQEVAAFGSANTWTARVKELLKAGGDVFC